MLDGRNRSFLKHFLLADRLGSPLSYGWRLLAEPLVSVSEVLEGWFGTLQGAEQKNWPANSRSAI